ncbi:MAG: hypothetical protein N2322_03250, partial [Terrimicrobiaceae bacterium]|nr:hypothetical protein [Terrimicrobiaceae bacterium]
MKHFFMARSAAGAILIFAVGAGAACGQNLQELISGVLAPPAENKAPEPSASEQLAWAEAQLQEAEAKLKDLSGGRGGAGEGGAPLDPSQRAQLEQVTRELVETWTTAVGILQAVVLREQMAAQTPAPLAAPENVEEAAELEARAEELGERLEQAGRQEEMLTRLLERAHKDAASLEEETRAAAVEIEKAGEDSSRASEARARLLLAEAGKRLAEARIFSLRWQQYREALERESQAAEIESLRGALRSAGFDQVLSRERAESQLAAIESRLPGLARALEEAERRLAETSAQVAKWRAEQESSAAARARLEAALPELELREALLRIARGRMTAARQSAALWQRVAELGGSPPIGALDRARKETAENLEALEALRSQLDHRLAELGRQAESIERQSAQPGVPERVRARWREQLEGLGHAQREGRELAGDFQEAVAAHRRVLAAIQAELARLEREQTLGMARHALESTASKLWNTQLFALAGRPFTLGVLLTALVALAAAVIAA